MKVASEVRKKLTGSFDSDSLDRTFSDIELFLATFPEDENIKKASVNLVVATLKAIEDTIGFFIQNSGKIVPSLEVANARLTFRHFTSQTRLLSGHQWRELPRVYPEQH